MNPIHALANLDMYLSALRLDRGEHAAIQQHITNIRRAIEAGAKGVEDGA